MGASSARAPEPSPFPLLPCTLVTRLMAAFLICQVLCVSTLLHTLIPLPKCPPFSVCRLTRVHQGAFHEAFLGTLFSPFLPPKQSWFLFQLWLPSHLVNPPAMRWVLFNGDEFSNKCSVMPSLPPPHPAIILLTLNGWDVIMSKTLSACRLKLWEAFGNDYKVFPNIDKKCSGDQKCGH